MKAVKIANLKSQLSRHLREVRAGAVVTVLDRSTPIARLVPIDQGDDLVVTRPAAGAAPIGRLKFPRSARPIGIDVVRLLLKDRQDGR
jgi:prevent-host-death family protein